MAVNSEGSFGWPFRNHAMEIRGTQTVRGPGRQTMVYPRRKYTFLVEFFFNPAALDTNRLSTNLLEHIQNGRLMTTLKSVDHPKVVMETTKLRSYNKWVIVPTRVEYQASTVSFHDDNSSIAMALWREYRSFYQHEGDLRNNTTDGTSEFRYASALAGEHVRATQDTVPSLGMKLKSDSGRHFFDAIRIYDLGADPDSVNIYTYVYPVITTMDHDGLDYEDRSGLVGVNMTFDYEGYYHTVGENNTEFHEVIDGQLGVSPTGTVGRVPGHARMTDYIPVSGEDYYPEDFGVPDLGESGEIGESAEEDAPFIPAPPPVDEGTPLPLLETSRYVPNGVDEMPAVVIENGVAVPTTQTLAISSIPSENGTPSLVGDFYTPFSPSIPISKSQYESSVSAIAAAIDSIPESQLTPSYLSSPEYQEFTNNLNAAVSEITNGGIPSVTIVNPSIDGGS